MKKIIRRIVNLAYGCNISLELHILDAAKKNLHIQMYEMMQSHITLHHSDAAIMTEEEKGQEQESKRIPQT